MVSDFLAPESDDPPEDDSPLPEEPSKLLLDEESESLLDFSSFFCFLASSAFLDLVP